MMTYFLIALIWQRPLMLEPDSGVIQIEFNTLEKCEQSKQVIRKNYNITDIKCIGILK